LGKGIAEKLEMIWEANERSKIEIAQAYGIPLSTLLTCLKNRYLVDQQALQGGDVSDLMLIHCDVENQMLEWFCNAEVSNIAVNDCSAKEKASEIILKMAIEFKCLNGWLQCFKE
jgi:hypothetical protein